MSGDFLSCCKVVKDPCKVQEGRCDFPRDAVEKGRLEGRTSWFFSGCGRFLSSYDGDLRDPLVWPQESPVSMRVARGLSGFLCSRCWGRGPHLDLRPGSQASSPVPTWILGFLWSFHKGVRPHLVWRHASPLSSRAGKAVSGFLSVDIGISGFFSRCRRAVTPTIMF